jgi:serine/threonine protein kinase
MLFLGNLLLTKDRNHVKLAGFEVARDDICDEMTCEAGTYRYMAPEQGRPYPKADKARALGLSFLRPFWLKFRPHIYIYIKY